MQQQVQFKLKLSDVHWDLSPDQDNDLHTFVGEYDDNHEAFRDFLGDMVGDILHVTLKTQYPELSHDKLLEIGGQVFGGVHDYPKLIELKRFDESVYEHDDAYGHTVADQDIEAEFVATLSIDTPRMRALWQDGFSGKLVNETCRDLLDDVKDVNVEVQDCFGRSILDKPVYRDNDYNLH